jgi:hypothetical protein
LSSPTLHRGDQVAKRLEHLFQASGKHGLQLIAQHLYLGCNERLQQKRDRRKIPQNSRGITRSSRNMTQIAGSPKKEQQPKPKSEEGF